LGERKAGVFIHGLGRQGKSSLAARVADRLEARGYKLLVVHGRYDAPAILQAFKDFAGNKDVAAVVEAYLKAVEESPQNLQTALSELLEGPCCQVKKDSSDKISEHPVLLIIDDFEQALEGQQGGGRHRLKKHCVESILATIKAFDRATTDSRLLFTSRFQLMLPDAGRELANLLLDVPLPPMEPYESEKQAGAKVKTSQDQGLGLVQGGEAETRIKRIVATSKGNPGLQDWLFRMAVENPESCDRCLEDMEVFLEKGEAPDEQEVLKFLESLALDSIVRLLSAAQKEVLRVSTLFQLPVPQPVMAILAQAAGLSAAPEDIARIPALGLWDVYEDSFVRGVRVVAINPLVRPLAGQLTEIEKTSLAELVVRDLFGCWSGPEGSNQRSSLHQFELTRLALLARQGDILLHTAQDAVSWRSEQFAYREAARIGEAAIACIEETGHMVPLGLRRVTAVSDQIVGEVPRALTHLDRALQEIERRKQGGQPVDPQDHGGVLLAHARLLTEVGKPDDALFEFQQARSLFKGNHAIALGEIARLLAQRGEVDQALKLHQEELAIYEALSDKRSQALTLVNIARLLAQRGEVDQALTLYQENLAILAALGDKRSRAITLVEIARLLAQRGEVDQALTLYQENLAILAALGDKRSQAIIQGEFARLLAKKGEVEQALKLHQENLAIAAALGDKRGRAITLGDIARLLAQRGEVDQALKLHQEELAIYEALGNKQSRALTLGEIARLFAKKGEMDQALKLHQENLAIWAALGDKRGRAITLGDIADLLAQKGEVDQALKLHQEKLAIGESLKDCESIACALWSIGQIELQQLQFERALEHLAGSYDIYLKLGELHRICRVGHDYGLLLCGLGHRKEGLSVLEKSRDGLVKLGQLRDAGQMQSNLDQIQRILAQRQHKNLQ
jgi:tetratricopeptide (TPR) repeat protein